VVGFSVANKVPLIMDCDASALMSVSDEEHWEKDGLFASMDASKEVNTNSHQPDEPLIVDLKEGGFTSTLPYDPCHQHNTVTPSECTVKEFSENIYDPLIVNTHNAENAQGLGGLKNVIRRL
jgi:hypothetical protein